MIMVSSKNPFLSMIVQKIRTSSLSYYRENNLLSKVNEIDINKTKITLFLETSGCYKIHNSGCTMCGFACQIPINKHVSQQKIIEQFDNEFIKSIDNQKKNIFLKIYTNGSFLDNSEISSETRTYFLDKIHKCKNIHELTIESDAKFVKKDILLSIKKVFPKKKLQINLGMETTNDLYRNICINKGVNLLDYKNAIKLIKQYFKVGVYLLFKPPFLSEKEAIDDLVLSIKKSISMNVDKIIINPSNVQKGTLLHYLWTKGDYSHPWLWSLIEVIKQIGFIDIIKFSGFSPNPYPIEMIKNCGKCDKELLFFLKKYPSIKKLPIIKCNCINDWKYDITKNKLDFKNRIFAEYYKLANQFNINKEIAKNQLESQL